MDSQADYSHNQIYSLDFRQVFYKGSFMSNYSSTLIPVSEHEWTHATFCWMEQLIYEGCPKSLAQLLIKTKKLFFNEKSHYNPVLLCTSREFSWDLQRSHILSRLSQDNKIFVKIPRIVKFLLQNALKKWKFYNNCFSFPSINQSYLCTIS